MIQTVDKAFWYTLFEHGFVFVGLQHEINPYCMINLLYNYAKECSENEQHIDVVDFRAYCFQKSFEHDNKFSIHSKRAATYCVDRECSMANFVWTLLVCMFGCHAYTLTDGWLVDIKGLMEWMEFSLYRMWHSEPILLDNE